MKMRLNFGVIYSFRRFNSVIPNRSRIYRFVLFIYSFIIYEVVIKSRSRHMSKFFLEIIIHLKAIAVHFVW